MIAIPRAYRYNLGQFTVTFTFAFLPLAVCTVMTTLPFLIPLTTPLLLTVAIFLLLLVHVSLVLALAGVSVVFSAIFLPTFTL